MSTKRLFTQEEAKRIGDAIGVNWEQVRLEEFRVGLAWNSSMGRVIHKRM